MRRQWGSVFRPAAEAIAVPSLSAGKVHRRRPHWYGWSMLAPVVAFLGIIFLYPVANLLWLSAVDRSGGLTAANYAKLSSSLIYVRVLVSTFKIAAWTTVICLVAGYPVAYLLATTAEKTRNSLLLWVLMPFWTSFLVRTFAWMVLLGRKGALNDVLVTLGVVGAPLELIYNFTGVMIGMSHALMPIAVLTMLSVMQNIDDNLMKAAATLGAPGGQAFWRVYFPLSLPGVAASGLLVFITAMGFFVTPTLLGSPREMMIAQLIIFHLTEMLDWGFAGALSVMLLVVATAVFYLYDRLLGMSTLAGSSAATESGSAGRIALAGHWLGGLAIAGLGWATSLVGKAITSLVRRRADRPARARSRALLWMVGVAIIVFLAVPSFFVIPVSFSTSSFIDWPPRGFSLKWYAEAIDSPVWRLAALRSLGVGIATATLSMLLGVPAAFALTRQRIPAKTLLLAFILSPLILPHIIVAVALFYLYARVGLLGTSFGLVLGHTVFAVPFVVVTVMAVLKTYDIRLDQAAWSLGAPKLATARRITFPIIRAGMMAAFLFAFVKSFDELTVALFVSGGLAVTLPRQMWTDAITQVNPTLTAVSTLMLMFVTAAIFLAEFFTRRGTRGRAAGGSTGRR